MLGLTEVLPVMGPTVEDIENPAYLPPTKKLALYFPEREESFILVLGKKYFGLYWKTSLFVWREEFGATHAWRIGELSFKEGFCERKCKTGSFYY